ncbi:MAG TPA: PKD domain-containing protein [Puia sp.]|nr:PKD domain-containing protein [Puia sp.]
MIRLRLVLFCCLYGIGLFSAHAQVPVADFSASTVSGCASLGVQFTDKSTGSPSHWTWDFGNGSISSRQNPSVTYTTAGVYTVTLIVQNSNGSNSIRKTNYITVYPSPTANFGENLTLACAPAHIQFNDLSTAGAGGAIVSWAWAFGDGTTSNQQNPAHTYTNIGYNSVSLAIINSGGCSTSYFIGNLIRVIQGVQPNFTYTQTTKSCAAPYQLNFNNQTAGPGTMTYNWSFGNGLTDTATNPSTVYPAGGVYTVILTAQSSLGCGDTVQQAVSFGSNQAQIVSPDQACTNVPLTFTNASTPAPISSTWDFGDGTGSTDLSPAKTYSTPNAYKVQLVNTYATCTDTSVKTIQVVNNPTPAFTADVTVSCKAPLTVNFTDQTSPAPASWLWDFGDGTTSVLQNPSHTYNLMGSFDVKLTVTTAGGCDSTITKTKFINVAAPSLTFAGTADACISPAGITPRTNLTISAVDGVASYLWAAPGATPSSSTVANPTFKYPAQGTYDLSLTITTLGGCTVTNTFPNAVLIGTPLNAVISATPNPACASDSVDFSSSVTTADNYSWYFGDRTTFFGKPEVKHLYKNWGTYGDTLYVRHSGCVTRATTTVTVNPPIAGFTLSTPDCLNRLMIQFADTSQVPVAFGPYTYLWNFGDPANSTSTAQNPTFQYSGTGTYIVTLTVSNAICSNTIKVPITLNPSVASIQTVTPPICRNTNFLVTSNSTNASLIASYYWQIDGGAFIPGGSTYTANIPTTGTHQLGLKITDIYGCSNTATQNITVTGPIAKFTPPTPAGGCVNTIIQFIDNTVAYAGNPITTWSWNYGDGPATSSTGPGPRFPHTYADTGSYTVQLIVTDNNSCVDTFTAPAPILITSPQALFSVADTLYCPNAPLQFIDSSQGHGLTYSWNFGDGTSSTAASPAHPFTGYGMYYPITLQVTDQAGCSNTLSRPGYIHIERPIAAFDISDTTTICTPLQTNFASQGQYYDSLYWKFGDGSTSTLPTTSHFYNTTGTFNAKLILKGAGGCEDSATRRVFVLDGHTATTFTYSPLKNCDSVLTLFNIIPPAFTFFYTNYGDGVVDSTENTKPSHLYKNPGTYGPALTLRDSTGCLVGIPARSGNITVLGAVPFFSANTHAFCDTAVVILADYTITNDAIKSETWNFGDGTPNATRTTPPISPFDTTHLFDVPGKIPVTLKVNTASNCAESYTDTVRVYQTPRAQITTTGSLCTGLIQFNGTLVPPDADTITWAWNFGNGQTSALQNPAITAAPGTYTISLRTSITFGCTDTTSRVVTIDSLPSIKGPKEITTPVGIPVTIPFTYSNDIVTYVWAPPINLDCNTCPNPTATLTNSQLYAVTVTDVNGCVSSDSILVKTICNGQNYFLPNTFSPNHDGVNDVFYPRGNSVYNIQSLRIFNRWGQMVFEKRDFPANSASDGWDGNFNGRPAPSDVYIYIAEVLCNNSQVVALKGDITLVR